MSLEVTAINHNQAKQSNPVKKGAKIGTGVSLALIGASAAKDVFSKDSCLKEGFKAINDAAKEVGATKGQKAIMYGAGALFLAIIAAGITAINTGIGAGVGKLVDIHNKKKEADKQEIVERVKAELIEDLAE